MFFENEIATRLWQQIFLNMQLPQGCGKKNNGKQNCHKQNQLHLAWCKNYRIGLRLVAWFVLWGI
jgi:hypothetical protein